MKRTIKFRGKSIENFEGDARHPSGKGQWVCGSLWHDTRDDTCHIWDEFLKYWIKVEPDTVGQFTGLLDNTGKEIFDGDILTKHEIDFGKGIRPDGGLYIKKEKTDVATMSRFPGYWLENESFGYEGEDLEDVEDWEIIGNIYDNPELIKNE